MWLRWQCKTLIPGRFVSACIFHRSLSLRSDILLHNSLTQLLTCGTWRQRCAVRVHSLQTPPQSGFSFQTLDSIEHSPRLTEEQAGGGGLVSFGPCQQAFSFGPQPPRRPSWCMWRVHLQNIYPEGKKINLLKVTIQRPTDWIKIPLYRRPFIWITEILCLKKATVFPHQCRQTHWKFLPDFTSSKWKHFSLKITSIVCYRGIHNALWCT